MTSTRTVSVNAEELRTTFEFVSFGAPLERLDYQTPPPFAIRSC